MGYAAAQVKDELAAITAPVRSWAGNATRRGIGSAGSLGNRTLGRRRQFRVAAARAGI